VQNLQPPEAPGLEDLFPGRGESAALMRAIDWATTPLGPTEAWPQSLQTIVPIMLASRFAMRVLWGPEFIFLYNDAYRPILGASKHPSAMASRTAESFREVWDIVGPLFRRVYEGEAIARQDILLPLDRNGYLEECYFTLSYSPILDGAGVVGGLLGVVHETTDRVLAERRLRTLRELAAGLASNGSPEEGFERAAKILEHNPTDVPFALFYVAEPGGLRARLARAVGLAQDAAGAPAMVDLRTPSDPSWPFAPAALEGRVLVVSDVRRRFGALQAGPYPEAVEVALVVPIARPRTGAVYGFLVAGVSPRRALDDAYTGFFDLVSEHIASSVTEALDRQEREMLSGRERAADERLRLLFNEAPASIALTRGPHHVYELANPLYCRLVGRSDLLGRPGREALPELVEQGIWDIFDRVYSIGEPFVGKEFPTKFDRKGDGTLDPGYFNFTAQPMRGAEGRIEGVMIFVTEITDQVLARQEEARARAAAEEGRAERSRLLQSEKTARAEAERSNTAKDEFLAIVSHELRNPLSAMLGWTRLLRAGGLSEKQKEQGLETIERNAVNQSQLIEDLLDVSRIVSGKFRLEVRVVNFVEVVQAALDSARPAMDAKQLRVKAVLDSEAISLMGDATRLQQVVWNLLTNAMKFTPKGGSVQVVLKRVDSVLELAVADTGRGIGSTFLPYVFEPFRQADASATRAQGGLGLGLSIAKNLVEMHGGSISAQSEGDGLGSTFVVRLPVAPLRETPTRPLQPGASGPPLPPWECPQELTGLRVLVVDDELDARELIATVLEKCGATVERAGSTQEALSKLEAWRPDVLLSDIGMPEEDGYALIRQVRGRLPANGGSIPAASLTAYASPEDRKRALLAGFTMHVPKPVEPSELVAVVASLARIARALR
jgi:signal transduction histidine kinase/ActR/RegA family two-component response regulator